MAGAEHLARFGLGGTVGRFRAPAGLAVTRGARVVLRTPRGLEVGEAIRPAPRLHAAIDPDAPSGELLRLATPEDETVAASLSGRAQALLRRGTAWIAELGLPAELLDAEVLFDGRQAVVHHVCWAEADLRELVRPLSRELELSITLTNVGKPLAAGCGSGGGCGDGGCGDGGCGSGGGCGSSCGTVSAEEVRAHFAGLREQMERRVSLL